MRLCQELAELGMQLARFAAARAMQDLAAQPAPEQPSPNAATLFTRLSHAVRQAILLENRIAAELEKAGTAKPAPPPDDRRRTLRRLLHCAATTRPDGSDFKRIAHERLDIELALDPHASTGDILATICETLGVELPPDLIKAGYANIAWPPLRPTPSKTPPLHPIQPAPPNPEHARRT